MRSYLSNASANCDFITSTWPSALTNSAPVMFLPVFEGLLRVPRQLIPVFIDYTCNAGVHDCSEQGQNRSNGVSRTRSTSSTTHPRSSNALAAAAAESRTSGSTAANPKSALQADPHSLDAPGEGGNIVVRLVAQRPRIARIATGEDLEQKGRVGDGACHGAGLAEQVGGGIGSRSEVVGYSALGRLDAVDAAEPGGDSYRPLRRRCRWPERIGPRRPTRPRHRSIRLSSAQYSTGSGSGLQVGFSVCPSRPYSGVLVLPRITAPAFLTRSTTTES